MIDPRQANQQQTISRGRMTTINKEAISDPTTTKDRQLSLGRLIQVIIERL